MYITILLFFGFVLVFLVVYYCRVRLGPGPGPDVSVRLAQYAGEQKQKHLRADIRWPVSMETAGGTIEGEIIDISLSGAFICCKKPLPLGDVFRLTMMGPGNEPVAATAKVVWSNVHVPDEKIVNRGMGVRFLKMSDRHIRLVRNLFQGSDEPAIRSHVSPKVSAG